MFLSRRRILELILVVVALPKEKHEKFVDSRGVWTCGRERLGTVISQISPLSRGGYTS